MGRPEKKIDKELFENMCSIFATSDEICQVFGIARSTLYLWCERTYGASFQTVYNAHAGKGKISLRRAQLKLAQTNSSMAIWLGKQILGQTELVEDHISGNIIIKNEVPLEDTNDNENTKPGEIPTDGTNSES